MDWPAIIAGLIPIGLVILLGFVFWYMERDDKNLKQEWRDADEQHRYWVIMQQAVRAKARHKLVINLARSTLEAVSDQKIAGFSLQLQRNPEDTVVMLVMADRLEELEQYVLANEWRLMVDKLQREE